MCVCVCALFDTAATVFLTVCMQVRTCIYVYVCVGMHAMRSHTSASTFARTYIHAGNHIIIRTQIDAENAQALVLEMHSNTGGIRLVHEQGAVQGLLSFFHCVVSRIALAREAAHGIGAPARVYVCMNVC